MSTIQRVNLEPVSDILAVQRRDFPLADPTLATPSNPVCLIDGEWLTLNSSGQIVRATTVGTPGNPATVRSFILWGERGRTDMQAIRRAPLLWLGDWEADTRLFDASAVVGSGAAISTMFQPVKVATITLSGRNVSGLVGHGGAADTALIEGYVTRLPNSNGGKLRIMRGGRH